MPGSLLPPGQIETRRFPVVGERAPSEELPSREHWQLRIHGLVERPAVLSWDEYLRLDHRDVTFDIHCVTGWTRFDSTWRGIPLFEVLAEVRLLPEARFVSFVAYSSRGHHTSLPLDVAQESSWLVHEFEGEPLTREHGGPVRVVTPGRYFYKSLKWVKEIELLAQDRLGWWETNSSYHNVGDPWAGDQRFTTGSIRPQQLERFMTATSYDKYRGRVMLGLDLRGWSPASRDLRRLYLKNCDLRGVDLSGADLRESNLSLSNLAAARLVGADLSGSDLEGADFTDADLSGADLSSTALTATRFDGARVEGASFAGSWGLVESQQRYLAGQGIDFGGEG
ncbi:MAG TPA: nitrate reductase [Acidimicrobiia bacterium]|nr:nitrate reductase [Acidimicrobiia bacterium]